jgi:glycosyltransferase involved in cell wall biosynthesis
MRGVLVLSRGLSIAIAGQEKYGGFLQEIAVSSSLTVVLPCFNEAEAIPKVIGKLLNSKPDILATGLVDDLEVIVVNDGSTDGSKEVLAAFEPQIKVVDHPLCRGYGRALKTGFREATGSLIAFFDLDDTCQPIDLIPMIEAATKENVGMITGNRMGITTKMPKTRWVGNYLYQTLTRILLQKKVTDCCSGFRLFHARYKEDFIENLPEKLNFSLAMTISHLRRGETYREIPITYADRVGESKLSVFSDGPLFLSTLLHYSLSPKFSKSSRQYN